MPCQLIDTLIFVELAVPSFLELLQAGPYLFRNDWSGFYGVLLFQQGTEWDQRH